MELGLLLKQHSPESACKSTTAYDVSCATLATEIIAERQQQQQQQQQQHQQHTALDRVMSSCRQGRLHYESLGIYGER